ncbi:MAG: IS110 family transposase [Acidimicrobiales bacterium]
MPPASRPRRLSGDPADPRCRLAVRPGVRERDGDVTRFRSPAQLASWAGLTPKHHESDTTVHRGPLTKQGSRLVRWAAVEAAQRQASRTKLRADSVRIAAHHGDKACVRKIARVAVARKIVTLVYFGLT